MGGAGPGRQRNARSRLAWRGQPHAWIVKPRGMVGRAAQDIAIARGGRLETAVPVQRDRARDLGIIGQDRARL